MQEMLCCDKTDNIYSLYLVSEELIKDDTPPPHLWSSLIFDPAILKELLADSEPTLAA